MFMRNTETEREHWIRIMARGRGPFILRHGIIPTLVIGFVVLLGLQFLPGRGSLSATLLVASIMLPIFLLGGYLEG